MTVADDQIAAISKLRDKTHDLLRSVTHAKRSYVLPPPLPRQHNAQHEPAARPTVPPLKTSRHPSSRQKLPSPTDGIIADSVQPRPTRPRSRTSSPQKAPNRGTTGRPISPLPLTLPSTRPPLHSGAREFRNNRKADAGGPGCRSPSPTQQREAFDRRAREAEQVLFTRDDEWIERLEDFRRVFPDWFHATDPDDRIRYQVDAAMHRAADQAAAVDLDAEDLDALPRSDQAQDVLEDERFYYGGVFRVNERLFPEHVRPALPFANTSDERTGHRWELGLDERPVKVSIPMSVIAEISRQRELYDSKQADMSLDIRKHLALSGEPYLWARRHRKFPGSRTLCLNSWTDPHRQAAVAAARRKGGAAPRPFTHT